jgi:ABC-type transport system involved in multi-copper enzyme maturation permease subunit
MSTWRRLADGIDNPIVVKEGVSRMRTWRAPVVATLYVSLIGAVGFAWLNLGEAGNQFNDGRPIAAVVGSQAFAAMAFFQLGLVCLFAPALAAGAISGERERQTLDVLLVSRVSAFGIVWGKLLASMAYILLLILTALPLFSAVFLFGGIDLQQFVYSQVVTIATALCLGAMAVFFSALFQRSLAATVASYASAFVLTFGTAIVSFIVSTSQTFSRATAASASNLQAAAEWYFNPFYALYNALFPNPAAQVTPRGFLQLLFFGVPPGTGSAGPLLDPWFVCVVFEAILAVAAVAGAVYLVRSRRVFRPRRMLEPSDAEEAVVDAGG